MYEKKTIEYEPDRVVEAQDRPQEDALEYGLEPTTSDDVVVGAEIGGVGGAVAGAIAGSTLGVAGAVTGAVIGGVLGAAGSAAAVAVVDKVDDDTAADDLGVGPLDFEAASQYVHEEREPHVIPDLSERQLNINPPPPPVEINPEPTKPDRTFPDAESEEATNQGRPGWRPK